MDPLPLFYFFFFFNDTATTEIYTLSLHDALPISRSARREHRHRAQHDRGQHAHPRSAGAVAVSDPGAAEPAAGAQADQRAARLPGGEPAEVREPAEDAAGGAAPRQRRIAAQGGAAL